MEKASVVGQRTQGMREQGATEVKARFQGRATELSCDCIAKPFHRTPARGDAEVLQEQRAHLHHRLGNLNSESPF